MCCCFLFKLLPLFFLSCCVCMWEHKQKQSVAAGRTEASTWLDEDFLHEETHARADTATQRAVHQRRSSHSPPWHIPDYFHIKHGGLQAEVKSRTVLWVWQCLSGGCASKRAGQNRRIPLILSNWVAVFAAVHRMWETRDKKASIYSLPLLLFLSLLLFSPPSFSRACYCVNGMLSVPLSSARVMLCFPWKFHGSCKNM